MSSHRYILAVKSISVAAEQGREGGEYVGVSWLPDEVMMPLCFGPLINISSTVWAIKMQLSLSANVEC